MRRRRRYRNWTREERWGSAARAAFAFLKMVDCSDCGLPWPEGYVHFDCPGRFPDRGGPGIIRRSKSEPVR